MQKIQEVATIYKVKIITAKIKIRFLAAESQKDLTKVDDFKHNHRILVGEGFNHSRI